MAIPAGFIDNEEKSPPKAPKALPMEAERAVPVMLTCENRNASSSVCAEMYAVVSNDRINIDKIVFIVSLFFV